MHVHTKSHRAICIYFANAQTRIPSLICVSLYFHCDHTYEMKYLQLISEPTLT